jgi:Zn-dependent peptidase ImmA (M78 family)
MMTYEEIIRALFSGEAGQQIPTGLSFSYPLPAKDEDGKALDHFFLYSVNRASGIANPPQQQIGIRPEENTTVYCRKTAPTAEALARLMQGLPQRETAANTRVRSLSMKETMALVGEYKQLYPQVRQFAFSPMLTKSKQEQLEKFFHIQRKLFRSQLDDYRANAPEFYSWMIRLLNARISFVELLKNREVRLPEVSDYLKMAANDEEKQLLLGLTDAEFAFWQDCGYNSLRLILAARRLKLAFSGIAADAPALIAARAYDPNSAAKQRKPHEKRLEEARQIARDIREEYGLEPFADPDVLAEKLGVRVEHVELEEDIDGFVQLDCDSEVITINDSAKDGYNPRHRFTLAHELGHVAIPWHAGTIRCKTDDPTVVVGQKSLVDSQEREANAFASELLIPSDWLRERKARAKRLDTLLDTVRKQTKTSVLASLYALEYVLNPDEVIGINAKDWGDHWTFLRGADVTAWKTNKKAFAELELSYELVQEFTKGTYTIRHYKRKA